MLQPSWVDGQLPVVAAAVDALRFGYRAVHHLEGPVAHVLDADADIGRERQVEAEAAAVVRGGHVLEARLEGLGVRDRAVARGSDVNVLRSARVLQDHLEALARLVHAVVDDPVRVGLPPFAWLEGDAGSVGLGDVAEVGRSGREEDVDGQRSDGPPVQAHGEVDRLVGTLDCAGVVDRDRQGHGVDDGGGAGGVSEGVGPLQVAESHPRTSRRSQRRRRR